MQGGGGHFNIWWWKTVRTGEGPYLHCRFLHLAQNHPIWFTFCHHTMIKFTFCNKQIYIVWTTWISSRNMHFSLSPLQLYFSIQFIFLTLGKFRGASASALKIIASSRQTSDLIYVLQQKYLDLHWQRNTSFWEVISSFSCTGEGQHNIRIADLCIQQGNVRFDLHFAAYANKLIFDFYFAAHAKQSIYFLGTIACMSVGQPLHCRFVDPVGNCQI